MVYRYTSMWMKYSHFEFHFEMRTIKHAQADILKV